VAVYCASKAAVISITQSDARPHQARINVNGISPGVVDTPMWDEVDAMFAKYEGPAQGERNACVAAVPYAWANRRIMSVARFSSPAPKAITSWRRLSTSTADNG
jgi:D-sorbitol dehydrogenase (acceptor)